MTFYANVLKRARAQQTGAQPISVPDDGGGLSYTGGSPGFYTPGHPNYNGGAPVYNAGPSFSLDNFMQMPTDELSVDYRTEKGKKRTGTLTQEELTGALRSQPARAFEYFNDARWQRWANEGVPFEQALLREANPGEAALGLERVIAGNRAERLTNNAFGTAQRQIRATGIRQDDTELSNFNRRLGLSRVLNRVDAQNAASKAAEERRDMVRNYAFDAEGNAMNTAAGGLGSAAQAFMARKMARKGKNAADDAGLAGLVGQGIGLAASIFAMSHSSLKTNIAPVENESILDGLRKLNINRWTYKGEETTHIGPMAEEFHHIFGVGDGVTIELVDVMGVLLGAAKEIADMIKAKG